MPTENVSHRLIREPVTQVGHGTHDPVIAPPGIFLRHLHTKRSISSFILGRAARRQNLDPSNLLATSFRYQPRIVFGSPLLRDVPEPRVPAGEQSRPMLPFHLPKAAADP